MNVVTIRNYKIIQILAPSMKMVCKGKSNPQVQLGDVRKSSLFKESEYDLRLFINLCLYRVCQTQDCSGSMILSFT